MAVAKAAVPAPPSRWPYGLRLSIKSDGALAIGRATYCPPRPGLWPERRAVSSTVETVRAEELDRIRREIEARERGRRQFVVRVVVAETGHVASVDVVTSTGDPSDDEQLVRQLRDIRFDPATVDEVPVSGVWVGHPNR